jgi:hypothetical protein
MLLRHSCRCAQIANHLRIPLSGYFRGIDIVLHYIYPTIILNPFLPGFSDRKTGYEMGKGVEEVMWRTAASLKFMAVFP